MMCKQQLNRYGKSDFLLFLVSSLNNLVALITFPIKIVH